MLPILSLSKKAGRDALILIIADIHELPEGNFSDDELQYIRKKLSDKSKEQAHINRLGKLMTIIRIGKGRKGQSMEKWRRKGESLLAQVQEHEIQKLSLQDCGENAAETLAIAEGLMLGNYQFIKYRKDAAEKESPLKAISLVSKGIKAEMVKQLQYVCEAVYLSRSLVNEPLSFLNAEALASSFEKMSHDAGIKAEVFNKQKIESLKMGGLLAVNRGSIDPPTFTVMEYCPSNPVNSRPIVFVGKGVVYDTGGLSLKPNSSMDYMKSDMAGAAAVAGAIYAIAKAKLPVHVVALVPATDNRPDGNAYVPGDIIHMMDGTTVEVLNTDAEGRLILADALTYAANYKPMLVIDLATLTGAAQVALGRYGMAGMQANAGKYMSKLREAGSAVHERIAEFPFWDEYADLLKSDIADLKNVGGPHGGAITAGKFLQHFTSYPWIHLDIAGMAFLDKKDGYRSSGGTGVGVRLLYEFCKTLFQKK